MNRRVISALVAGLALTGPVASAAAPETAAGDRSPYAGQEQRAIKALSTDEIEALRNGDGMGFAKAAELNGYPGPRHVLDLARQLDLTTRQHRKTRELFETMHSRAVSLGERLIQAEAALDDLFRSGAADKTALRRAVAAATAVRGELRLVHLNAHLDQARILSAEQVRRYRALRGYHGAHGGSGEHH